MHHHSSNSAVTLETLWPFSYKAAIFDFDGTIADSLHVWRKVDDIFFGRRGLTYGPDYAEKLSTLGFEDGARYTVETYGLPDTPQDVCREWNELGRELYLTDVTLYPGAIDYIRALHSQGIPVALATTNDPNVINVLKERIDLDKLFPIRVHGRDVDNHTKDHPDIYLEASRRMEVDPTGCVVFEDLPAGLKTAASIGMRTVAVANDPVLQDSRLLSAAELVLHGWSALAEAVNSR